MASTKKQQNPTKKTEEVPAVYTEPAIKDSWFWIKDSKGNASATTTFALVAFVVTTIAYVMSIFERIGFVEIRAFDVAACSAYLIPILSLYYGRRFTEARYKE